MTFFDKDLFENIEPQDHSTINAGRTNSVSNSYLIERPSTQTKAPVQYVRLNDDEHNSLQAYVAAIDIMRSDKSQPHEYVMVNLTLDKSSGIWGSKLRKFSTLREVLEGVIEKLAKPHKFVAGRKGEDLSVKQLTAINAIITDLGLDPINIPTK